VTSSSVERAPGVLDQQQDGLAPSPVVIQGGMTRLPRHAGYLRRQKTRRRHHRLGGFLLLALPRRELVRRIDENDAEVLGFVRHRGIARRLVRTGPIDAMAVGLRGRERHRSFQLARDVGERDLPLLGITAIAPAVAKPIHDSPADLAALEERAPVAAAVTPGGGIPEINRVSHDLLSAPPRAGCASPTLSALTG
jgi:hypothetical protein